MSFGRRILSGGEYEAFKDSIDAAKNIEELAAVVAAVPDPADREKILYAAQRRASLMLTTEVDRLLKLSER